jgi:uncharacterized phage-associated protein
MKEKKINFSFFQKKKRKKNFCLFMDVIVATSFFRDRLHGPNDEEKVMKLLYYAQGIYLKLYNEPLFPGEDLEAGEHGPVFPKARDAYYSPSEPITSRHFEDILNRVLKEFEGISGDDLVERTRGEAPWKDVFAERQQGGPKITTESMIDFFSSYQSPMVAEMEAETQKHVERLKQVSASFEQPDF